MSRITFGKAIADHSVWEQRVAEARRDIEMTRLLCLKAADRMDKLGNKGAARRLEIAMNQGSGPASGATRHRRRHTGAHGGGGRIGGFPACCELWPTSERCALQTAPGRSSQPQASLAWSSPRYK